jgi:hypothetical protein
MRPAKASDADHAFLRTASGGADAGEQSTEAAGRGGDCMPFEEGTRTQIAKYCDWQGVHGKGQ